MLAFALVLVLSRTADAGMPVDDPAVPPTVAVTPGVATGLPVLPEKTTSLGALSPVLAKWNAGLYGFLEFDALYDTTQSYNDVAGNAAIARPGTYAGDHPRLTFSVRHSRLGFTLSAPEFAGIKASAVLEFDFLGNLPPNSTEAAVFTTPILRMRQFAVRLESRFIDVLLGQTNHVFGFQPYFFPASAEIMGTPGQLYGRAPQLRVSHTFKTSALNVEVIAAASRPPQRDAAAPDGEAGVRLQLNPWKGVRTISAARTETASASLGVSGVLRRFNVPEFSATPTTEVKVTGWGVSVDALLPLIRATNDDRGNGLTLTGSFVDGTGISDLYTGLTGGITWPSLPNPSGTTPPPTYPADADNGLVTYDSAGNLHTVDWRSLMVGLQYYLPPSGRVFLSVNYAQLYSGNAASLGAPAKVFNRSHWADATVFVDVTPAVRLALAYGLMTQQYADGVWAQNHRVHFSAFFLF